MIKKKAKSKTAKKKTGKKRTIAKKAKELNPTEVRKDIALMVQSEAAHTASIFPPSTDGTFGTPEEDSLAMTLLQRLNIPDTPVTRDEEDAPQKSAVPVIPPAATDEESAGKESEAAVAADNAEPVLV